MHSKVVEPCFFLLIVQDGNWNFLDSLKLSLVIVSFLNSVMDHCKKFYSRRYIFSRRQSVGQFPHVKHGLTAIVDGVVQLVLESQAQGLMFGEQLYIGQVLFDTISGLLFRGGTEKGF